MKILHLISSINRGGAENHLFNLASYQSSLNHSVSIIFLKGNGYWKKKLQKKKINVIYFDCQNSFNLFKLVLSIIKIVLFIRKFNPDIIHAHLSLMEFIATIIKIFTKNNFKFIITKHLDSFFLEGSRGFKFFFRGIFFDRIFFYFADKIIFISKYTKSFLLNKCKINKSKYSIIYYGIEISFKNTNEKILQRIKKKYKIKKNNFIICKISRHVEQKNLDFLIKSFSIFNKNYLPNSKLLMIGEGPKTDNLKKLSEELKINKKIIWVKYTENIAEFIKSSHIFCLPSFYEGFGLVLLEAMILNKPIVASNASTIPEIIKNNYNGLLIDPNNICSLVHAFRKLTNKKMSRKFIINGKKILNKKFNISNMLNKNMQIYNSIYKS